MCTGHSGQAPEAPEPHRRSREGGSKRTCAVCTPGLVFSVVRRAGPLGELQTIGWNCNLFLTITHKSPQRGSNQRYTG